VAPPFKQAEFDILYNEGISRLGEVIELGVSQNLIDKAGAWFSYKGQRIGQGKDNARNFLKEHPAMAQEIEASIRQKMLSASQKTVITEPDIDIDEVEEEAVV